MVTARCENVIASRPLLVHGLIPPLGYGGWHMKRARPTQGIARDCVPERLNIASSRLFGVRRPPPSDARNARF